jgi:hypothetical protein
MPIEVNIKDTVFSKQIYDAGNRFACDQFLHSIGVLMARNDIDLEGKHTDILFNLSPRELSDLNVLLHHGDKSNILAFLDGPRVSTARGSGTI